MGIENGTHPDGPRSGRYAPSAGAVRAEARLAVEGHPLREGRGGPPVMSIT